MLYIFAIIASIFPGQARSDTPLYVQGSSLALRAEPNAGSAVLLQLKQGEKVTATESKGMWSKVKAGGKAGWVPVISLSKQPAPAAESVLQGKESVATGARRRSNAVSTAGAARGLLDAQGSLAVPMPRTNLGALQKLMSYRVSPKDAAEFVQR